MGIESLVIIALLGAIAYLLFKQRQTPASQASVSADSGSAHLPASPPNKSQIPAWLEGWPKQALIFVASAAIAFLIVGAIVPVWMGIAGTVGGVIGLSAGWVTILVLAGLGFYIHKTNAAPKFQAFLKTKWAALTAPPEVSAPSVDAAPIPTPPVVQAVEATPDATTIPKPDEGIQSPAVIAPVAAPQVELPVIEPSVGLPTEPATESVAAAEHVEAPFAVAEVPSRRKTNLVIACAAVGLTGGAIYAASALNPQAFGTITGWVKSATGFGGETALSDGTTASAGDLPDGAEEIAVDKVLGDFVRSALVAYAARDAIVSNLNVELANTGGSNNIDRIRLSIAGKEQAIAEARKSAQDAVALIAEVSAADPAIFDQAIGIVRGLPEAQQGGKGSELLAAVVSSKGLASEPEKFSAALMAAWERATAVSAPVAAQTATASEAAIADPPSDDLAAGAAALAADAAEAAGKSADAAERRSGNRVTPAARSSPSPAQTRPRWQPGSAYDRMPEMRERHPRVRDIPPEEFEQ